MRLQYNSQRYHPAWGSLALDYLAIMSSSVSSERTFSQGGITISKQHSCLKGDIVEALQCIKCALWHDLLFRERGPSLVLEAEETSNLVEDAGAQGEPGDLGGNDVEAWDGVVVDDNEEGIRIYWSDSSE